MNQNDAWDLYFTGLVGWTYHPGYLKDENKRPTLDELADIADEMLKVRNERCPGLDQQ